MHAFNQHPLSEMVLMGQFWIFTPITHDEWDLIHPDDWPTVCKPGLVIGMSFFGLEPCGACSSDGPKAAEASVPEVTNSGFCYQNQSVFDLVRLVTPTPHWWSNQNAKFKPR